MRLLQFFLLIILNKSVLKFIAFTRIISNIQCQNQFQKHTSKEGPMKKQVSSEVREFDPRRVRPLPNQPRVRFRGISGLAESIKLFGQTTPGVVTLIIGDPNFDAQLIDGERRLRACILAKVKFRAEVGKQEDGHESSQDELREISFFANFNRQDHDCLEIAAGLAHLQKMGRTIEHMAKGANKSTAWVSQHLSLLRLHSDVQAMMIPPDDEETGEGEDSSRTHLTFSLALLLVPLAQNIQIELAQTIVKDGLSLSAARRTILKRLRSEGMPIRSESTKYRKRQLGGLRNLVNTTTDRLGVYIDMPGPDFARLIDETDFDAKKEILRTTKELAENLSLIAEIVEERMPKVNGEPITKIKKT